MEETCTETDPLKVCCELSSNPEPQGKKHQCKEINMIEFLCNDFIGHLWAIEACNRTGAQELAYKYFDKQIEVATNQEVEKVVRQLRDQKSFQSSTVDQQVGFFGLKSMYTQQPLYAWSAHYLPWSGSGPCTKQNPEVDCFDIKHRGHEAF